MGSIAALYLYKNNIKWAPYLHFTKLAAGHLLLTSNVEKAFTLQIAMYFATVFQEANYWVYSKRM